MAILKEFEMYEWNNIVEIVVDETDFYPDTFMSVACLRILYPEAKLIRTKTPKDQKEGRISINTGYGMLNSCYVPMGIARVMWTYFGRVVIEKILGDDKPSWDNLVSIWNTINMEIMTLIDFKKVEGVNNDPKTFYGILDSFKPYTEDCSDRAFLAAIETATYILKNRVWHLHKKIAPTK